MIVGVNLAVDTQYLRQSRDACLHAIHSAQAYQNLDGVPAYLEGLESAVGLLDGVIDIVIDTHGEVVLGPSLKDAREDSNTR